MSFSNVDLKHNISVWVSCKSLRWKPAASCLLAVLKAGQQWIIASQLPLLLVGYETSPSICSRSRPAPARLCRVSTIHRRPFYLMDAIHSFPACSLAGARQSPLGNESTANAHNHATADEWQDHSLSDSEWFSRHCWADFVQYSVPVPSSVARCVMRPIWGWNWLLKCIIKALCHLLSIWHIQSQCNDWVTNRKTAAWRRNAESCICGNIISNQRHQCTLSCSPIKEFLM